MIPAKCCRATHLDLYNSQNIFAKIVPVGVIRPTDHSAL